MLISAVNRSHLVEPVNICQKPCLRATWSVTYTQDIVEFCFVNHDEILRSLSVRDTEEKGDETGAEQNGENAVDG